MTNNEWKHIEDIFHAALDLDSEQRVLYLSDACSGNQLLFSEINSLISAFERESQFLEEPPLSLEMQALANQTDQNLLEQTIGTYRIKEKLGSGGMGIVYLAEDMRLNRNVALKFLKRTLLDDSWAERQFTREAQAAAMLNHPNICSIHGIEEIDDHNFIVMQYVEGRTLSEVINGENLSLKEILSMTEQIVNALAHAHSHGIIHRDIKPGNIIITSDKQVKVLDFGLAKIIQQKQKTEADTIKTTQISQNGLILGTISYMSPEQLRAEKLDYRSDIFSVGILIYEMLEKKRPFDRKSQADVIAAILGEDPLPLKDKASPIFSGLYAAALQCLNKDKEKRFQSAVELLIKIEDIKNGVAVGTQAPRWSNIYSYAMMSMLLFFILTITTFLYQRDEKVPVLAILPIVNKTERTDEDYISTSLTGNLIARFSRLSKLKVIAQPLISQYEKQEIDARNVGQKLKADAVITGRLTQENALTLEIVMTDTESGKVIFRKQYPIDGERLISAEQDLSREIIVSLLPSATTDEINLVSRRQTSSPEAQDSYFLGRYYWQRQDGKNMKEAISYFKRATEQDPLFAQSWSGLANAYAFYSIPSFENPLSPAEAEKSSRYAAKIAMQLDPELPEPYTSLGMIELNYGWNWQEGENNFKKALSLDPNSAPALFGYSRLLTIVGRYDEALGVGIRAEKANPLDFYTKMNMARIYAYKKDFQRAEQIYNELSENFPDKPRVKYGLGLLHLRTGRLEQATNIFEEIVKDNKPLVIGILGYTYARTNRKPEALQLLAEIDELAKSKYISAQEKAIIYFGLNDREKAFEYLQKACDERFPAFPAILKDSLFEEFQSDLRFQKIKKCAHLSS